MNVSEMISKVRHRREVFVAVTIHTSLAARTRWDNVLYLRFLLLMDDMFFGMENSCTHFVPVEKHKRNQNKIPAEWWNFHEFGKRSKKCCWARFFPQGAESTGIRQIAGPRRCELCCPLLYREQMSAMVLLWLKPFLSHSTCRHKCWWSLWLTLPEGWSTSAARTSSTETSLLATACKHKLCFHFLLSVPDQVCVSLALLFLSCKARQVYL